MPLAVQLTAANVHDSKALEPLVDAVQPIRRPTGQPGRPRKRPTKLHGDKGYDYLHHAEVGSSNAAFVGDEVTDRFCVLGEASDHVAKLRELEAAGVDQFNVYLMNGDEEGQLEHYGRDVIPAMR